MLIFLARRIAMTVPVVLGVVFFVVLIVRITPGNPALILLGQAATPEAVASLEHELGLDESLPAQYGDYLRNLLHGNLGRSYRSGELVTSVIADALPNTLLLTLSGLAISLLIGLPIGIVSALRRNTIWDHGLTVLSLLGLSMPVFWTGIILQWALGYQLRLLPTSGIGGIEHLIMPAFAVGSYTAGNFARMVRGTILDVLSEEFIRTAWAKGLGFWRVLYHVIRNAILPVITTIGLQVGLLLGGSILTETVFAWPGIGRAMVEAINSRDIVLTQGLVLVTALLFVATNLIVDISYAFVDPRIKRS